MKYRIVSADATVGDILGLHQFPNVSVEIEFVPYNNDDYERLFKACYSPTGSSLMDTLEDLIKPRPTLPSIKNVYFNDPATVVLWDDGTKTIVKCQDGDTYSKEVGLALCISKKALGNKPNFNDIFKKWIPEEKKPVRGFHSKLNLDEWDKMENTYSDKLYRCAKEACVPKYVYRSCHNCLHNDEESLVCMGCGSNRTKLKLKE